MEPFLPPDPTQQPQPPNNTQTKDEAARALVYMSSTPNQEESTTITANNVCPPVLPPPSLPAPQNSSTRKSTDVKANKTTLPIKKQARRLCSVEGCTKQAKKGGICIKHGAKVRKCSHEGCTNNALKSGDVFDMVPKLQDEHVNSKDVPIRYNVREFVFDMVLGIFKRNHQRVHRLFILVMHRHRLPWYSIRILQILLQMVIK